MGVDLIDTADSYGPEVSERLIFEALHPYPEGLVIATKAGLTRQGPGRVDCPSVAPSTCASSASSACAGSGVERIDLFQLHRIDPKVPADEQFGLLADLVAEGKVSTSACPRSAWPSSRRPGPSSRSSPCRTCSTSPTGRRRTSWSTATAEGIGFIPWFPVASGALSGPDTAMADVVDRDGGHAHPGGAGLAAPPLTRDAAHPGHQVGGPRRGELRGGDPAADRCTDGRARRGARRR